MQRAPEPACVFCRIASRTLPAAIVAEAEGLVAFRDVNPQAPTHLLIIPTEHIPSLTEVTEAHTTLLGRAIQFANGLAREHQLTQTGYRLVVNCGAQAGQSVWHLHLHLLGGRPLRWPPG
jgi:histidine triad (HIT) family protein